MSIRGSGGSKSAAPRAPVESPDDLASDDFASILDLISEGEIEGLVADMKSIFFDDIQLQNNDGTFNFDGVTVETRVGTAGQASIGMISGTESEVAVGVQVEQALPISRSISNPDVDRIRVSIGIPTLSLQNTSNGDLKGTTVQYKISVSSNGGAFVDANIGGGSWVNFTGLNTVIPTSYIRAAIHYTPNQATTSTATTVRLEYRVLGSASTWSVAGESKVLSQGSSSVFEPLINLQAGYRSKFIEILNVPLAIYELRAVLVSTNEAIPGTVNIVNQATGSPQPVATVTGKTTSRYKRSHVINLKAFGPSPYIIKVTRITADSLSVSLQNSTFWDSYTEIVDEKLSYPHSALVALRMASKQFPAIPTRGYHIRGLKIKVPSNYDPITRIYSGIWDGLFVVKWSNNPAWIFYDLCTNNRYGAGQHITPESMDKWALYSIAQYCDELVPNGIGGLEPRYTCNTYIQDAKDAYALITSLAAVFRAMTYWGAGTITPIADRPSDPVYHFTQANVVDGMFNYTGSSIKVRHNVALVTWNDPADRYRTKVEYVADDESIAEMGVVRPTDIYAIGCTSQGQARRVGRWLIYTERFETDLVNFKVGLDGNIPLPGDIILISDPVITGERRGGRLVAATTTHVTIDSPITITTGYSLTVVNPAGGLETRNIVTGAGTHTVLEVSLAFSLAPLPDTVWIISSSSAVPQTFKTIGITPEDDGAIFTILALRTYPDKFALIESNTPLTIPNYSLHMPRILQPEIPTGLVVSESIVNSAGRSFSKVIVSWDSPPVNGVRPDFESSYKINEGNWIPRPKSTATSFDIDTIEAGDTVYVSVYSVTDKGAKSEAITDSLTVVGVDMDDILTPTEKSSVLADYNVILGEKAGLEAQATSYGITTEKTAYSNSITTLTTYLNTLTQPFLYSDLAGITDIVGSTFRTKFQDVYLAKQVLVNKIVASAKALADAAQSTANTAASNASAALASASSAQAAADGAIKTFYQTTAPATGMYEGDIWFDTDDGNKIYTYRSGSWIVTQDSQIAAAINSAQTAQSTADGKALVHYQSSAPTGKTAVDNGDIWIDTDDNNKMYVYSHPSWILAQDWYAANVAAGNAQTAANNAQTAANNAQTAANTANADLANIASDSVLTPDEKPRVIQDRDVITQEQAGIDAQATAYSITTEKTAYDTAVSAFTTYLATLTSPVLWSNLSGNTTIVGTTFRTKFADVYSTRQTLLNKIYATAKTIADGAQGTANTALVSPQSSNQMLNSQFFSGADAIIMAWNPSGSTYTVGYNLSADWTLTGENTAYLQETVVGTGSPGHTDFSLGAFNVVAGKRYEMFGYFGNHRCNYHVNAIFYDSAGVYISEVGSLTSTYDISGGKFLSSYDKRGMIVTAPAGAVTVRMDVRKSKCNSGSDSYLFISRTYFGEAKVNQTELSPWSAGSDGKAAQAAHDAANNAQTAANTAQSNANTANAELADISADGVLSKSEKIQVIREFTDIDAEYAGIDAQAASYGITTERWSWQTTKTDLNNYLNSLSPAWNNITAKTNINRTNFKASFNNYYYARQLLLNKIYSIAKYVADGAQYTASDGRGVKPLGDNLVGNGHFINNYTGIPEAYRIAPEQICDGWFAYETSTSGMACWRNYNTVTNGWCLAIGNVGNVTVPAYSSAYQSVAEKNNYIPARSGDRFAIKVFSRQDYDSVVPAGLAVVCNVGLRFFDKNDNYLGNPSTLHSGQVGANAEFEMTQVAPANAAYGIPYALVHYSNPTGSAIVITTTPMHWRINSLEIRRIINLDKAYIEDGSVHGRLAMQDSYNVGGVRRLGLRVGSSGHQIGDQRNLRGVTIASQPSRWTGLSASATFTSASPAVVSFSMSAASLKIGSATVSYNSSSANVNQTRDSTVVYKLYYLDDGFTGGSKTLNVTTNGLDLSGNDNVVWITTISVTVPDAATGGGGDPPEEPCVASDMWIDEFGQAGEVTVGQFIECSSDNPEDLVPILQKVQHNIQVPANCTRIVSESGAAVVASDCTPMTLRDGSVAMITEMLNKEVLVFDGAGVLRWENCVSCLPVGERLVSKISVSDNSYFAGESPSLRIATHNVNQKP